MKRIQCCRSCVIEAQQADATFTGIQGTSSFDHFLLHKLFFQSLLPCENIRYLFELTLKWENTRELTMYRNDSFSARALGTTLSARKGFFLYYFCSDYASSKWRGMTEIGEEGARYRRPSDRAEEGRPSRLRSAF